MKGFIRGVFAILLTTALTMLSSCDKVGPTYYERPDSVYVADCVNATINPSFTSVQEVLLFQNKLIEQYSIEDVFKQMPANVLKNVAMVCLKKNIPSSQGCVKVVDIVAEYKANKTVYDSLSEGTDITIQSEEAVSNTQNKPTDTAMEEQQKPVGTVSYRYETDTIEGKPVRVLVEEKKTYE